MLASVVSVAMTARYLGPGRYGQLTIAVVFIGMWTSLADLGIGTVIVRRVTSGRGELERLVRVNSGLSLVYCVPLAALVPRLPSPTRQLGTLADAVGIHEHDSHVGVVIDEQSSPRLPNDTCKVASGLAIPAIPATAQEVPNPLRDQ